ncbi:acyltransferase family protein [Xanthobacter autotrophicus]|uniref:acyltransferase family protein n=1 Tax=Xanthobacter autotrophicus TaxID=280 RepID=UPI00372BE1D0
MHQISHVSTQATRSFREDINGLRALAVICVVLFHYKFAAFDGGFIGVDIFFVISGFLMTQIVISRINESRFSVWEFYKARTMRIVPALLFLCFVLLFLGFFLVDPIRLERMSKEVIESNLFISNIVLWREVGYFDSRAEEKWLLHTWSLGVEWQFYILFPVCILALTKLVRSKSWLLAVMLVVLALSFLLCLLFQNKYQQATFYLLPTRAWEFLFGGCVAVMGCNRGSRLAGYWGTFVGLVAILVSMVIVNRLTLWPSLPTLLPVLGTCAVIWANDDRASWAANPVMRLIGLWSYSIYIWHWPFFVGWSYLELPLSFALPAFGVFFAGGAVLVTLAQRVLAERADILFHQRGLRFASIVVAWIAITGLAANMLFLRGVESRYPLGPERVEALRQSTEDWGFPRSCFGLKPDGETKACGIGLSNPGRPIVFLGDSHASLWYNRFATDKVDDMAPPIKFLVAAGCPPLVGMLRAEQPSRCQGFLETALHEVEKSHARRLILSAFWTTYLRFGGTDMPCFVAGAKCRSAADPDEFRQQVDHVIDSTADRLLSIRKNGTDIVIVLPVPSHDLNIPIVLAMREFYGFDTRDLVGISRAAFDERALLSRGVLKDLARRVGATILDPADYLCDLQSCATADKDGIPTYIDSNHIRASIIKKPKFDFLDRLVAP